MLNYNYIKRILVLGAYVLCCVTYAYTQVTAGFNINYPANVCNPVVIGFSNTSSGIPPMSYAWNFGVTGGVNSTLNNPSSSYLNCGNFTVTLTATNGLGQTSTITHVVTIHCSPVPSFTVTPTSGCAPLAVQFTNTSTSGSGSITGYTWDFGDGGSSSSTSPPHTYLNIGCKNVSLTVTNSFGCTTTTTFPAAVCVTNRPNASFTNNPTTSCSAPLTVQYNSTVSGGTPPYTYSWTFVGGTPAASANPNPTIVYNAGGTFPGKLIVTDVNGCRDTFQVNNAVTIGSYTTNFTASALSGCAPFTATFNGNAVPFPNSWSWTTNPAATPPTSNTAVSTFTFPTATSYQVCLTANYSNGCTAQKCTTVVVHPLPVAAFNTTGQNASCAPPLVVNYNNNSSGATLYQWSFPGGNPNSSNTANPPPIVYNTCGNYNATLNVQNQFGCIATVTHTNTANVNCPVAAFTASPNAGCLPLAVSFNSTSSTGQPTMWHWNFGDPASGAANISLLQNPNHTYNVAGCYTVTLITNNAQGCGDTIVMPSAVCTGPPVNANFSTPYDTICASTAAAFNNLSTGTTTYTNYVWDFLGVPPYNNQSAMASPTYLYHDTGWFDITLIACNYGCCDTITIPQLIYILGPVSVIDTVRDCSIPFSLQFDGTQSINATTYLWTFPPGCVPLTSTNPIQTCVFPGAGTYNVSLFTTNPSTGCNYTKNITVTMVDVIPNFTGAPLTGCSPLQVCFNNTSTSAVSYEWLILNSVGDTVVSSTAANPCLVIPDPGVYTVQLNVWDVNGCKDSLKRVNYVTVYGTNVAFTGTPLTGCVPLSVHFTDNTSSPTSNAVAWHWDFGDGTANSTSNAHNPTHVYLSPGSFTVTLIVTDNHGCMDTLIIPNYVTPLQPIADFAAVDSTVCLGTQACFFNYSSGNGPMVYLWNFGDATTSNSSGNPCHSYASTGTYSVSLLLTDVNGCTDTLTKNNYIVVSTPVAAFVADTITAPCPPLPVHFTNNSTGLDSLTTYLWDFGDGSQSTGLNPFHIYNQGGIFTVTLIVTNQYGCADTLSIQNYIQITGPSATVIVTPVTGCSPLNVCFYTIQTNSTSFTWDFGDGNVIPGGDTICYTYMTAGVFYPSVIISDGLNCSFSLPLDTITVAQPQAYFTHTPPAVCNSGTFFFVDSSTVQLPITSWSWNFGDPASGALNTSSIQNPNHFYAIQGFFPVTLTITLSNGCVGTFIDTMQVTAPPTAAFTGSTINSCVGSQVTFTDNSVSGSPVVAWAWNFGDPLSGIANTSSLQNPQHGYFATGTYTITLIVTSANGCTDTVTHTLTVHPLPVVVVGPAVSICAGSSTTLSSAGGVSYSWLPVAGLNNPNISNPVASPVATTTYTVTVTDNIGCSNTATVVVTVNPIPLVNAGVDASVCPGSSTNLAASGATSYSWLPATGLSATNIPNPIATPAATTSYTVTGTALGCSATDVVVITVYPAAVANAGASVTICFGANTQLNASGGVLYSWSPAATLSASNVSNPIATPVSSTQYTVTVTDANSCQATDSVTVSVVPLPAANAGPDVGICINSQTQLNASGGTTFSWLPATGLSNTNINNPIASPLVTTTYTVTVTGANNCVNIDSVIVTVHPLPTINAGTGTSVCIGSTINLNATGGTTYVWSPAAGLSNPNIGNPVATVNANVTYTVTGTDAFGCSNTDTIHLQATAGPPANAGPSAAICIGASTNLNASGGVTYSWAPSTGLNSTIISNPIASPLSTTQYTVTVTDASGCSATDSVTVSVHALPLVNAGVDQSICINSSANLSATGGVTFSWLPATTLSNSNIFNPVATPLATTTYTVTVTDNFGCVNNDSMVVTINPLPNIVANPGGTVCVNAPFNLGATGGVSYIWTPAGGLNNANIANPVANVLVNSTYTVTGTDANGCVNTDTVHIQVNALPVANAGPDDDVCAGSTSQLNGSGGLTFAWLPSASLSASNISNPVASPATTTTYTLTVTDANNCSGIDSMIVNVHPYPLVNAGVDDTLCLGSSYNLNGTGAAVYFWAPIQALSNPNIPNPSATPVVTTTYTLFGDDGFGCTGTDSMVLTVLNPFSMNVGPDGEICLNDSFGLSASGALSYQWTPATGLSSPNDSTPNASPSVTTTYTVVGYDNHCFHDTAFVTVLVDPLPTIELGPDSSILTGQSVLLNMNGVNGLYTWSPTTGLSCSDCPDPMASPTTTTMYNVVLVDSNGCRTGDSITIDVYCNNTSIFMANAFTPNNDGKNDVFYVRAYGLQQFNYMRVFDRWGQMVFETHNISEGWDGTYHGKPLASDVFVYYLDAVCTDGKAIKQRGNVTLIR